MKNFKILSEAIAKQSDGRLKVRYRGLHPDVPAKRQMQIALSRNKPANNALRAPACMRCRSPEADWQAADQPIPRPTALRFAAPLALTTSAKILVPQALRAPQSFP